MTTNPNSNPLRVGSYSLIFIRPRSLNARRLTVRRGTLSTQLLIGSSDQRYKLRPVRKQLMNSLGGCSRQAFRLHD